MNKINKFDVLTKYIPQLKLGKIGDWNSDLESRATTKAHKHMPFVNYSEVVSSFVDDVYDFMEANEDMDLYNYRDILKDNGIQVGSDCINDDMSSVNEHCTMALIVAVIRAEHFGDGIILEFMENGCIVKWLENLR